MLNNVDFMLYNIFSSPNLRYFLKNAKKEGVSKIDAPSFSNML